MRPLVSVVMSAYNAEKFIGQAIDSILNQSLDEFELLIINDGSSDDSRDIITSFNDRRIILIENDKNMGVSYSLNKGINIANGKYIARMDADDISCPKRLEKQIDFMKTNTDIILCGAKGITVDEFANKLGTIKPTAYSPESIKTKLLLMNQFIHPVVMFRKDVVLKVGGYSEKLKYAQDYHLWVRLLINNYKLCNINSELIYYRIHKNNLSEKYNFQQERTACKIIKNGLKSIYSMEVPIRDIELLRKIYVYNDQDVSTFELRYLKNRYAFLIS